MPGYLAPYIAEDRQDLFLGIYGVFLCNKGGQMRKGYRLVDLRKEYPGYTGDEIWMIITDLTEDQLIDIREVREIMHLAVVVSTEAGCVMRQFENSEKKHRKRKKTTEISLDELTDDMNLPVTDSSFETGWLYEAIEMLPEKQKRRILDRYINGLTAIEIAEADGCDRRAVSKSIRKGLTKLRAVLEETQRYA